MILTLMTSSINLHCTICPSLIKGLLLINHLVSFQTFLNAKYIGLVCRESSILVMQVMCFEEEKNHLGLYIYVLWEWTLSPLRFVVIRSNPLIKEGQIVQWSKEKGHVALVSRYSCYKPGGTS
jgi:hypothetical protein